MSKETKETIKKVNNLLIKLEGSINKKKKKWTEKNIIELLATTSILAKSEDIDSPPSILRKARKLVEEWYHMKNPEELKYLDVKNLYKKWSKNYDAFPNLATFLEEKATKDIFKYKNKNILDLGCGTGRYAIPLAKKNNVLGVDFSKEMLREAKKKAKKSKVKINFKEGDVTNFRSKEKFDLIISMLVQDHIKDLSKAIETMNSLSKVGTEIIISNIHPNFTYYAVSRNKNTSKFLPGFSSNQYYHPLEEYIKLFRKKGFELIDCKDLIFLDRYAKMKEFKELEKMKSRPLVILMKFRKVK